MRNNVTVVTAAVKQKGLAREHASEEMKANESIVTTAVTQNGIALEHASEDMKNNPGRGATVGGGNQPVR